ncbi:MAG TPA: MAPEG family protein [Allosphingosinicella sp.]|jgi:hypothetical protein
MALLTRAQLGVAAGMAGGLGLTLAGFAWPLPHAPQVEAQRLALWAACAGFAGLWLLVCVGRLAAHRFFTAEDIDGGGVRGNSAKAALLQAVLQNTLEQAVPAALAYAAWLWLGPPGDGARVALFALYFGAGRLLFFAGYARGAPWRALGFTLTFYPTVGLYLVLLPAIVGRLAAAV